MTDITIHIKFFGAFRKFGEGVDLSVPAGSTIAAVKSVIQDKLNGESLVQDSALANDNTILQDGDTLNANTELSILPPVCGG